MVIDYIFSIFRLIGLNWAKITVDHIKTVMGFLVPVINAPNSETLIYNKKSTAFLTVVSVSLIFVRSLVYTPIVTQPHGYSLSPSLAVLIFYVSLI